jgi:hypothetical protein
VLVAVLLQVEPRSYGVIVIVALGGVIVGIYAVSRAEDYMSENVSVRNNPGQQGIALFAAVSALSCAAVVLLVSTVLSRTTPALNPRVHIRDFLLDAKTLIAAATAMFVSIPPFFKSITNLRKEWKHMRPRTQREAVRLVTSNRSVVIPMFLGVLLAASGSSILAARAAVVETGKAIGNVSTFSVDENYAPTGKMGDIGDVSVEEQQGLVRFVYETKGRGPHLWEWKYDGDGKENSQPALFAGVMYLDPRGNWGSDAEGGFDLRNCHRVIKWEARSISGPVEVKFLIGGDKRDVATKERGKFQFPNTLDQSLGIRKLDTQWETFEFDLSKIPDDRFKRIVGGFGWIISWSSNGVEPNNHMSTDQPKTFTIEIRNVRYEQ